MTGQVFDLEEFAVYDGPGIRYAVFLKGCPLRCHWCHNPEGLSAAPQIMVSQMCVHCGACRKVCPSPERCTGCGACVGVCPVGARRLCGRAMTAEAVAEKIRPSLPVLQLNGGGVTFTGGEVLMQPDFVLAVRALLPEAHAAIETSGYAQPEVFQRVAKAMDLVIMDVKLTDPALHRRWTGVDNGPILRNLDWLKKSGIPFWIRIPLIPTVNDTEENMRRTAALLQGAARLERVELLPYHKTAGAKYAAAGMNYDPGFPTGQEPQIHLESFQEAKIPCVVN